MLKLSVKTSLTWRTVSAVNAVKSSPGEWTKSSVPMHAVSPITTRTEQRKKASLKKTNQQLLNNYKALFKLNKSGKTKVTEAMLTRNNFDFSRFTSMLTTPKGDTYRYCYDQGYLKLEDRMYLIVEKTKPGIRGYVTA